MTNEQAIKWLKDYRKTTDFTMPQYEEALDMAIKALQEQADRNEFYNWDAPIRHKADGEYIPRDAVIDQLHQSINLLEAEDRIRELPSVAIPTEEPKTGHWIKGAGMWICNQCGYEKTFGIATKFCSQCGAKMGGEEDG